MSGIYYKKKIEKVISYILKSPAFLYTDEETFLNRYTASEWSEYELWLFRNRLFTIQGLKYLYKRTKDFREKPRISIIMPVYNPDPWEFKQAVDSILWQVYPHWELCIVDDFSDNREYLRLLGRLRDRRIRVHVSDRRRGIAETSQYALQITTGDYMIPLDQDDELYPDALYSFVNLLQDHEVDYFYSDRDIISPRGKRYMHFFKPDWSPEYLLSFNYVTHLEVYNKQLVLDLGGFRKEYEGSQDYDLALRVTEKTSKIRHYPMILYSWRQSEKSIAGNLEAKSYIYDAGVKAVIDTVKRRNLPVKEVVENPALWRGHYRIVWDKDFFSDKKMCFITVSRNTGEINRVRELISSVTDSFNVKFASTDYNVENINAVLKNIKQEEYVFFCEDTAAGVVSSGLIDMLGYLSIDGVSAVGCKFLDFNDKIFNVGLSISSSGAIIFNYRGSPHSEHGYGAAASAPRNVSAIFPAFWGCKIAALREKNYLKNEGTYFQASMNFFMEIIKSNQRIVCVPYMCLKVDTDRIQYDDEMHIFSDRWVKEGLQDKYYNPNLTDRYEDFGIKL